MKKNFVRTAICLGIMLTFFSTMATLFVSADSWNPYPADGSTGVSIFIDLSWNVTYPGVTYDVYFGTNNSPGLVSDHQSTKTYDPGMLIPDMTYYWYITIHFNPNTSANSLVWRFTTAPDQPPFDPRITAGPTNAGPGIPLNFTAIALDPEGDHVSYLWDWGDGNMSKWIGPYAFGDRIVTQYQWQKNGTYAVKIRAKDEYDKVSTWSDAHSISIAPQLTIGTFKQGVVYFNLLGLERVHRYVPFLDEIGASLILSTTGFTANATAGPVVRRVTFVMTNLFSPNEQWTQTVDNVTGNCSVYYAITPGFYKATAYGYDENGTLIDHFTRNYIFFIQISRGGNSPGLLARALRT